MTYPEKNFANYKVFGGLRRVDMNASEFYRIYDELERADNGSRVYMQVTTGRSLSAKIHTCSPVVVYGRPCLCDCLFTNLFRKICVFGPIIL